MKTIIVCTDFSPEAENATHYAASMAKENKYRIIITGDHGYGNIGGSFKAEDTIVPPVSCE